MASRLVKQINKSYRSRYIKKSSKGMGYWAYQPPGTGPNGVHITSMKDEIKCKCAGCSRRLHLKTALTG